MSKVVAEEFEHRDEETSRREERELPKGWVISSLGECANYGVTTKVEPNMIPSDSWLLELEDIEKDTSILISRVNARTRTPQSTKNAFYKGDVLYGKLRPYLRKVILADSDGFCSTEIIPLRSSNMVLGPYLFYFLKSKQFNDYATTISHGMNMPRLGTDQGRMAAISLPPFPEQERIAARLDVLLGRLKAARLHIDVMPEIIKRFRKSVLAQAVSGKLTEEWRAENVCSDKKQELSKSNTTFISDIASIYVKPEIPSSWMWVAVNDIASVKGGKRVPLGDKISDCQTEYPYIVAGALKNGTVLKDKIVYLDKVVQKKICNYIVASGDVYITIVGACIGDAGIIPVWASGANLTENALKITNLKYTSNHYLSFWLRSPIAQGFIKGTVLSGAQGKLALGRVRAFPIPLPSLPEQAEIVRRVEELFAYADALDRRVADARRMADRLEPAILAKAFRGELSEQRPEEAVAWAETLARLEAETAGMAKVGKREKKAPVVEAAEMAADYVPRKQGRPRKKG